MILLNLAPELAGHYVEQLLTRGAPLADALGVICSIDRASPRRRNDLLARLAIVNPPPPSDEFMKLDDRAMVAGALEIRQAREAREQKRSRRRLRREVPEEVGMPAMF